MNDPKLEIEPNPAVEGTTVEVTYRGEGTMKYSVDGGPWQDLPLDANGDGSLPVPIGARGIVFSDHRGKNSVGGFLDVLNLNK